MKSMTCLAGLVATVLCLGAVPPAPAQAPDDSAATPWRPPAPDENAWDWIRLNSGEWLGGTLEGMRDRDLEFDSDELGLLKLDWTDVAELRSPRALTYRFEDIGNYTGTAVMRGDTIAVATDFGTRKYPRTKLILILEGHMREINYWSARASLGLVTRSGNTSQSDVNTTVRLRRLTPKTRAVFDYTANYGEVESVETINSHNLSASFDVLVAAGFFVTPLGVNFFRDPFQNIDIKSTLGAGVGYVIMRDGPVDWSVGLGGAYQNTQYVSVGADSDDSVENFALIGSTDLEWELTDDIDWLFEYSAQVGVPDVSRAFHHARTAFSFDLLGDILELDFSLVWDRVESPQPDADGNVSEHDDFRTTVGIAVDL